MSVPRAAIVATPSGRDGLASSGISDAARVRELLSGRGKFEVFGVDSASDLAGQVEDALASLDQVRDLVFFASVGAAIDEGELVLQLDDDAPETADALTDVLLALTDRRPAHPPVVLLDLRVPDGTNVDEVARLAEGAAALDGVALFARARAGKGGLPLADLIAGAAHDASDALTWTDLFTTLRRALGRGGVAETRGSEGTFVERVVPRPTDSDVTTDVRISLSRDTMADPPVEGVPPPPPASSRRSSLPGPREVVREAMDLATIGEDEAALTKLRKALSLVPPKTEAPSDANADRALIHLRVGELFIRQARHKEAIASLEKVLEIDPDISEAAQVLRMLHTLQTSVGDRRGVSQIEERMLASVATDAERASMLLMFGQSWLRDFNDRLRARERLEHALALAPFDRSVLELLVELAEHDRRTQDSLDLRTRLAEAMPDPAQKATRFSALAEELIDRKREDEALDLFERALDAHPGGLAPLARLATLLSERQEWAELEGAYRRMLERAGRVEDAALSERLRHELHKRLAILLSEHIEDPSGALEEARHAALLAPADESSLRTLATIAEKGGRWTELERALSDLIALAPRDLTLHAKLFDVLVKLDHVERAFASASVLLWQSAGGDRERALVAASREELTARPHGTLARSARDRLRWSLAPLADNDAIDRTARVFRAADRALTTALASLSQKAGRLAPLTDKARVDPATSTVGAARAIAWAARALGAPIPAVYLEEASDEGMTAVLRDAPVTVVGAHALRGKSLAELSFLAGWNLCGHFAEHRLVRLCSSVDDLAACFIAAVRRVAPDTSAPAQLKTLVDLLEPALDKEIRPEEDAELSLAVRAFDVGGGRVDLAEYACSVERACLRAGYLLAADVDAAAGCLPHLPRGAFTFDEREEELMAFAVSSLAAGLRDEFTSSQGPPSIRPPGA